MSNDVTLSAATRQNLLSLQDTAALTATTQNRLATGKKVSSALDNPVNFFTSQNLDGRSSDLGSLLDGISNGIQTIQAANQGITNIQKLIDSAKSIGSQALATQVTTTGTAKAAFDLTTAKAGGATPGKISLYINGQPKTVDVSAVTDINSTVTALNTGVGSSIFSVDSTGTKIVLNASSDVEFADAASQTALGFQGGGTGTTDKYGTGNTTAGVSPDLTVSGVSTRTSLANQYNALLSQITQLAKDASYNGINLISNGDPTNKLHVAFNEKDTTNLDVQGQDLTASGLKLDAVTGNSGSSVGVGNFLFDADVKSTLATLTTASERLRSASSTLGSNLSVVQNRQDFTKHLINILDTGSANLTNADLNEEAANSQALTTRQSLGISALSLANQAQQGILKLLS